MKCLLAFVIALGINHFAFSQHPPANQTGYRQDLTIFRTVLEEVHPALHRYCPKEEWDVLLEQTLEDCKSVTTNLEFYRLLAPIAHRIGDSHFQLRMDTLAEEDTGRFVLPVQVIQGELYASKKMGDIPRGSKIMSINDIPGPELIFNLSKYACSDALHYKKTNQAVGENFERFMYYEYGPQNQFEIQFIPFGEFQFSTIRLAGSNEDYINEKYWEIRNNTEYELDDFGSYPVNLSPALTIIEDPDIAKLTIPTFNAPVWFFYRMILKHFKTLEKKQIKNLIIDVRDNSGGIIFNAVLLQSFISTESFQLWDSCYTIHSGELPLLQYATQVEKMTKRQHQVSGSCNSMMGYDQVDKFRKKFARQVQDITLQYRGTSYVLFNERSHSAASEFANFASLDDDIFTVGSESGASRFAQTAGHFVDYQLPYSGVEFHFGILALSSSKASDAEIWNGVIPDYTVDITQETLYHGNDEQLEKVISLIYQNKSTD